ACTARSSVLSTNMHAQPGTRPQKAGPALWGPADRRCVEDLDGVAVRVGEVARIAAVAMSFRGGEHPRAALVRPLGPSVHHLWTVREEAEVIQRRSERLRRFGSIWRGRLAQREIVGPRTQVAVLRIGLPDDLHAEDALVEVLGLPDVPYPERQMS